MTVTLEIVDLNLQRDHHFFVLFEFPDVSFAFPSSKIKNDKLESKPTKRTLEDQQQGKHSQEQQHRIISIHLTAAWNEPCVFWSKIEDKDKDKK